MRLRRRMTKARHWGRSRRGLRLDKFRFWGMWCRSGKGYTSVVDEYGREGVEEWRSGGVGMDGLREEE